MRRKNRCVTLSTIEEDFSENGETLLVSDFCLLGFK